MLWFLIGHLFSTLISLIRVSRLSEDDKDLEIVILRHQLDVMTRKQKQPVKPSKAEKVTLAQLTAKLKKSSNRFIRQLGHVIRIVRPETVIRWHREMVRRKWTQQQKKQVGRPKINREKESLIVRLAKENLRWGYYRIEGELKKLGLGVSLTTVRNVLDRNGILPAPVRCGSIGWRTMMNHYKDQLLACDFFTVETIFLKTIYVLFSLSWEPDVSIWPASPATQMAYGLLSKPGSLSGNLRKTIPTFAALSETMTASTPMPLIPFLSPLRLASSPVVATLTMSH